MDIPYTPDIESEPLTFVLGKCILNALVGNDSEFNLPTMPSSFMRAVLSTIWRDVPKFSDGSDIQIYQMYHNLRLLLCEHSLFDNDILLKELIIRANIDDSPYAIFDSFDYLFRGHRAYPFVFTWPKYEIKELRRTL